MKEATELWIRYASNDLESAEKLLKEKHLANVILFHCHQSVEKIIKGLMEEQSKPIVKIHGLLKLYELLPENIKTLASIDMEHLKIIDSIYVESRYPLEMGLLPNGFPTEKEAKEIFVYAKEIFDNIKSLIGKS